MEWMTSLRQQQQQQQKCYKPDESTLCHNLVWGRVQTTGIFDKHLSIVDITPLESCTRTNIDHWSVNLTKVKWVTHSRLLIKDRHVSLPLLFHTWQSHKWPVVVESQYQSVVRVVSWERVHNVHANIVKMYPSTNVSHLTSRANRFTDMHVSPSTVHQQLLAHFSIPLVVRQLLSTGMSVGKAMFPVSSFKQENVYQCYSGLLFLHTCVCY